MNFWKRINYKGIPELEMFPNSEARDEAVRQIERGMIPRTLKDLAGFAFAVFIALVPPYLVVALTLRTLTPNLPHRSTIEFGITLVLYTIIVSFLVRNDFPKALRRRLLAAGVPVCTKCGYDLRNIPPRDRCPECGRRISADIQALMQTPPP